MPFHCTCFAVYKVTKSTVLLISNSINCTQSFIFNVSTFLHFLWIYNGLITCFYEFCNYKSFLRDFLCLPLRAAKCLFLLKFSKSQKYFFLKLHCPKNERNFRQNSALASYFVRFGGKWSFFFEI